MQPLCQCPSIFFKWSGERQDLYWHILHSAVHVLMLWLDCEQLLHCRWTACRLDPS
jgi:hypothetical protein